MNLEIFIVSILLGLLGFALGFSKGIETTSRNIRQDFRDEGYDHEKFNDVINK